MAQFPQRVFHIHETARHLVLHVFLPGFDPKSIQVKTNDTAIVIRGAQRRETGVASFEVKYQLPVSIEPKSTILAFKRNTLQITMKKRMVTIIPAVKRELRGARVEEAESARRNH